MLKYILLVSLLVTACAHKQVSRESSVNIGSDAVLNLKDPKDIFPNLQWVQILSFEHKDKKNSIQAVLTSKDNKLTIVGLLPFGGEAFRVEYFAGEIRSKALPMGGSGFDLKFALADIILVYSDIKDLKAWLSEGVKVVDSGLSRSISYKGQEIIHVNYSSLDKPNAVIDYQHILREYKIKITPVSQGIP